MFQLLPRAGPDMFERYTHYAVINNGMRGPFVSASDAAAGQHWAQPFLSVLRGDVRLAGAYLSCEEGVHLQGPFLVTDRCHAVLFICRCAGCSF